MKLNKKSAGAIILALLVLLLFFSKTIYTYNMPQVTGTKPVKGSLSKLEISSGISSWADTETVYAVSAGAAGRVYVREGDRVEEGQVLFEMDFDVPAAQRRMSETENNINKMEADIQSQTLRLSCIREALAAAANNTVPDSDTVPDSAAVLDNTADQNNLSGQAGIIALEIGKAKETMQNTQFAFDLGSQSRNDLISAENNYRALIYKYQAEADDLVNTLAMKRIDLENLKLTRDSIQDILRDYQNNAVIKAPAAGVILSLAAERGKYFQENAMLVTIGAGSEFNVDCTVSLDNNFINPGDTCELSNSSHVINGTVRRVRPVPQGKIVSVTIVSNEVSDGETFDITFEKSSAASFTLVPNAAVNMDSDRYFLYQIKQRKGIMGNEYYVDRLNIYLGDSDLTNTAVLRGITFYEPIVLVSSKVLSAGDTVILKNPEDFFEN
ncbi:MAG: efflux RND transporter periplasmic adaptor subunit [Treponema sp.]|nr:efflux RND transporter periplasmic adaptor subunit [Treponema sp.]